MRNCMMAMNGNSSLDVFVFFEKLLPGWWKGEDARCPNNPEGGQAFNN